MYHNNINHVTFIGCVYYSRPLPRSHYFTCLFLMFYLAPSAPPTNLNGYAIDHTSLYFEWEPPQLYQQNGVVVQYLVNVTERETGLMFQRITTQLNITLMSLHPDYVYECSVSAVTVAEGPFSPPFMIRVHVARELNLLTTRTIIQGHSLFIFNKCIIVTIKILVVRFHWSEN